MFISIICFLVSDLWILCTLRSVFDGTMTFVCIFTMICWSSGKVVWLGEPMQDMPGEPLEAADVDRSLRN